MNRLLYRGEFVTPGREWLADVDCPVSGTVYAHVSWIKVGSATEEERKTKEWILGNGPPSRKPYPFRVRRLLSREVFPDWGLRWAPIRAAFAAVQVALG